MGSCARSKFYNLIGGSNDLLVMFDYANVIARIRETSQNLNQFTNVLVVQTNGGFIESKESIRKGSAKTGGKVNALGFTSA